jgi:hypothetical protein
MILTSFVLFWGTIVSISSSEIRVLLLPRLPVEAEGAGQPWGFPALRAAAGHPWGRFLPGDAALFLRNGGVRRQRGRFRRIFRRF